VFERSIDRRIGEISRHHGQSAVCIACPDHVT
jgi:hypothetical protein